MKEQVWRQVEGRVLERVHDQVLGQVSWRVSCRVRNQIWSHEQDDRSVWDQVLEEL